MLKRNMAIGSNRKIEFIFLSVILLIAFPILVTSAAFAEEVVEITVAEGDYLIKIAEEYLEDPSQWKEVARINRLKNPDLIYPHQTIVIPVRLLRGIPCDGVVSFVQGNVRVQVKDSEEWTPVLIHDRVKEGSKIETGDRGCVEIVFDNGTSCFQKSNTLTGFLKMRKKGDSYEQRLSLERGRTITRILKATGREPRFEIQTPSAVCAARGTFFRTSVDANDFTRSEVLEGKTEINAMKQKQVISEGEGTLVRKGEPPLKPRKLLPPPVVRMGNMPYKKLPLHFAFDPVVGAVSYSIWITRDRDGKDVLLENVLRANENVEIQDLEDGTYFLHALSIDEIGLDGISGEPQEIRIRVNPLPPFISQPAVSAEYREKSLQCKWLAVRDAVAYQVQVSHDAAFHQIVDESSAIAGTDFKTRELDYGSYYFRIRSVAEDGYEGAWSDAINFSIVPPPSAPSVESPDVDKKEIHIRWQDLGKGMRYHFQLAKNQDFSLILIDSKLEKPEIVIQRPEDPGTYYIHVSAIDSKGYEGRFSKPQSFTLKEGSLALFLGSVGTVILILSLLP